MTGGTVTCKLSGQEIGAAYSLWDVATAPRKGPRPHCHHGQDEDVYVLEGEVRFVSGEETVTVQLGDFVRVPNDTMHSYTVTSEEPCRMLLMTGLLVGLLTYAIMPRLTHVFAAWLSPGELGRRRS